MNTFDLKCLIKKPTCFQPNNTSYIDFILTNKAEIFINSNVFEVGISDCHTLIMTALRNQLVNPLQSDVAYLYPLKTLENLEVFCCFQGYR